MFIDSAGVCTFLILLAEFACGTSGSQEQDDFFSSNKRFLLEGNANSSNITVEQFASCYLTCTPTYDKLLETCCQTGLSVVCSNLPWDILKPKLGTCPGQLKVENASAWLSLEQFASCFLSCVDGYEKLTTACCQTGLDAICSNLPWEILKSYLGKCQSNQHMTTLSSTVKPTSPSTVPQPYWSLWGSWTCEHQGALCFQTRNRTCSTGVNKDCELNQIGEMATNVRLCSESTCQAPTTSLSPPPSKLATTPKPYWLPWGSWNCEQQSGACFMNRIRNCSTGNDADCKLNTGGVNYNIGLCTEITCPDFFRTTTHLPSTTTEDPCQDDPKAIGCTIPEILTEVCKSNPDGWKLCRRSCGLCDTCWDYLDCSSVGAQTLLCSRENYALQYCRKTCGKCDHKPVDVQLNQCGDPVSDVVICETLQNEICICNDPDVRALCGQYCDNKCNFYGYPYTGSTCKPARRKKRDAVFSQLILN